MTWFASQPGHRGLVPPLEAHRRALQAGAARPSGTTRVGIREPGIFRLSGALRAVVDVPAYPAAAMDGYAVCGSGPWTIAGTASPGNPYGGAALSPAQAVRISTGAMVPAEASQVIPWEAVIVDAAAGTLRLRPDVPSGENRPGDGHGTGPRAHVRAPGETWRAGAVLAEAGRRLSPGVRALAAATGHDEVEIAVPPRVAVIVTGSELDSAGAPGDGHVRDALGPLLAAQVPELGGRIVTEEHVPDDPAPVHAALRRAESNADVVVTTGMASHGEADHLRTQLKDLGARTLVTGVDIKPGKPQLLAALASGTPLVGLPGNPGAAMTAVAVLLSGVLAGMTGETQPRWSRLPEQQSEAFTTHAGRRWRLVAARRDGDGELLPSGWPLEEEQLVLVPPRDASASRQGVHEAYGPAGTGHCWIWQP